MKKSHYPKINVGKDGTEGKDSSTVLYFRGLGPNKQWTRDTTGAGFFLTMSTF